MRTDRWFTSGAAVLTAGFEVLTLAAPIGIADAASPEPCNMHLSVMLTPDVPNPGDLGFLSSLLSNQSGYRLTLERQGRGSVLVLDLSGPGPDDRCRNVIETMRRDAHVLSVDVERVVAHAADVPAVSDDTQTVSIVTNASRKDDRANTHLSLAGLGSLYWAARNPAHAWTVLLPVQPGDVAYGDIRTSCVLSTNTSSAEPACP
jgi:hypothetical protein